MLTTTSANPQTVAEPFPDLVEESLDEAAFLWRRWETELTSLTRSLDEIYSWTEDRLHGALDGVRVGGPRAVEAATKELGSEETDRITVGTAILGSITEPGAPEAIAAALKTAEGKRLDAMLRGLELLASDQALRASASVLAAPGPARAGALCRLKLFRRVPPGDELATAFRSNVPDVQVDAIRAARLVPPDAAGQWIAAGLQQRQRGRAIRRRRERTVAADRSGVEDRDSDGDPAHAGCRPLFEAAGDLRDGRRAAGRVRGASRPRAAGGGRLGTGTYRERARRRRVCRRHAARADRASVRRSLLLDHRRRSRARQAQRSGKRRATRRLSKTMTSTRTWCRRRKRSGRCPTRRRVKKHWLAIRSEWSANVRHIRGKPAGGDTLLSIDGNGADAAET